MFRQFTYSDSKLHLQPRIFTTTYVLRSIFMDPLINIISIIFSKKMQIIIINLIY